MAGCVISQSQVGKNCQLERAEEIHLECLGRRCKPKCIEDSKFQALERSAKLSLVSLFDPCSDGESNFPLTSNVCSWWLTQFPFQTFLLMILSTPYIIYCYM